MYSYPYANHALVEEDRTRFDRAYVIPSHNFVNEQLKRSVISGNLEQLLSVYLYLSLLHLAANFVI